MSTEQAFNDLLFVAQKTKGILELGERFRDYASFAQAESEVKNRIAVLRQEESDLSLRIKEQVEDEVDQQTKALLGDARIQASAIVDGGKLEADGLVSRAEKKIVELEQQALIEVQGRRDAILRAEDEWGQKLVGLENRQRNLTQEILRLETKLSEAEELRKKLTALGG